jgi:hypothetical protein
MSGSQKPYQIKRIGQECPIHMALNKKAAYARPLRAITSTFIIAIG